MWKEAVVLIFKYYPSIFLKGLKRTMEILSQDSWYQGEDINPGSLEDEVGMLITRWIPELGGS
jgi:hypothetical protein